MIILFMLIILIDFFFNYKAVVKEQEMRLKSLLAAAPRSPSRAFASSDHV